MIATRTRFVALLATTGLLSWTAGTAAVAQDDAVPTIPPAPTEVLSGVPFEVSGSDCPMDGWDDGDWRVRVTAGPPVAPGADWPGQEGSIEAPVDSATRTAWILPPPPAMGAGGSTTPDDDGNWSISLAISVDQAHDAVAPLRFPIRAMCFTTVREEGVIRYASNQMVTVLTPEATPRPPQPQPTPPPPGPAGPSAPRFTG